MKLETEKDGVSLLSILTGKRKELKKERMVFVNSLEGPAVISSGHWKLRYNKNRDEYRLHYLPDDYREERIVNDKYPEVLEKLKGALNPYLPTK